MIILNCLLKIFSLIAIKYFLFIEYEQLLTKCTEQINLNTFFYVVFLFLHYSMV